MESVINSPPSADLEAQVLEMPSEKLVALFPRLLIDLLRKQTPESVEPSMEVKEGALLFIDISGFSAVARKLQEFTDEGAEGLSYHLNLYFERLIEVIAEFDGDIIFFSGDAMLVAWFGPAGQSSAAAVLCGAELLKRVGGYTFEIESGDGTMLTCAMSIHMGGACGEVLSMMVGGKGRPESGLWKHIVVGQPVEMAGIASNLGTQGQLVFTQGLLKQLTRLGAKVTTTKVTFTTSTGSTRTFELFESFDVLPQLAPADSPKPDPAELEAPVKQVTALFTFDTLVNAVLQGVYGQMRTVSMVFIKFSSIDCTVGSPVVLSQVQQATTVLQKYLCQYDGLLNKIMMDDKGLICLCLFGVPCHTHEDDAGRSVAFADQVSRKLSKAVGSTSIGISRSTVFCGLTGSSLRNEYTVLGDGVNVAARLMCKAEEMFPAKRHLICDEETTYGYGIDRIGLEFIEGDLLVLKGQDLPLRCFHVVSDKEREGLEIRLAGGTYSSDSPTDSSGSSISSRSSRSSVTSRKSNSEKKSGKLKPSSSVTKLLSDDGFGGGRKKMRRSSRQVLHSSASTCDGEWLHQFGWDSEPHLHSSSSFEAPTHVHRRDSSPQPTMHKIDGWFQQFGWCDENRKASCGSLGGMQSKLSPPPSPANAEIRRRSHRRSNASRHRGSKVGGLHIPVKKLRRRQDSLSTSETSGDDGRSSQSRHSSSDTPRSRSSINVRQDDDDVLVVGRSYEVQAIQQFLEMVRKSPGQKQAMMFVGKPQVGKTHLLTKAMELSQAKGIPYVLLKGVETESSEQYAAMRPVILKVVSEIGMPSLELMCKNTIQRQLPLLHHIVRLPDLPLPDSDLASLPADEKERLVQSTVLDVLKLSVGPSFIIVADDVQWLDESTVGFLMHCVNSGVKSMLAMRQEHPFARTPAQHELLIASSYSPAPPEPPILELTRAYPCQTIHLEGLTSSALVTMLKEILDANDIDPTLLHEMKTKADNLPGFMKDMAIVLRDSGAITIGISGRAELTLGAEIDEAVAAAVPMAEAMVMKCVDRLTKAHRKALSVAAVIGNKFEYGVLDDILKKEAGQDGTMKTEEAVGVLHHVGLLAPLAIMKKRMQTAQEASDLSDEASLSSPSTSFRKWSFATPTAQADTRDKEDTEENTSTGVDSPRASQLHTMKAVQLGNGVLLRTDPIVFTFPLARDVIYNSTLLRDRKRLHRIAADVLTQWNASPEVLTRHLLRSGDVESGWPVMEKAVEAAASRSDFNLALTILASLISFAEKCLQQGREIDKKTARKWFLTTALCLCELGQLHPACFHCKKLRDLVPEENKVTTPEERPRVVRKRECRRRVLLCCFKTETVEETDDEHQHDSPLCTEQDPITTQLTLFEAELSLWLWDSAGLKQYMTMLQDREGSPTARWATVYHGIRLLFENDTYFSSVPSCLQSVFGIFLLAARKPAFLLSTDDDTFVPASKATLLPARWLGDEEPATVDDDEDVLAIPRNVVYHVALAVRAVVRLFAGMGHEANRDCGVLQSAKSKDGRFALYGAVIRAYLACFFTVSVVPSLSRRGGDHVEMLLEEHNEHADTFIKIMASGHKVLVSRSAGNRHGAEDAAREFSDWVKNKGLLRTPFHALALMGLIDSMCHLPDSPLVDELMGWLRETVDAVPVALPAYHFFKGMTLLHADKPRLAGKSFVKAITCSENRACIFAWRARANLLVEEIPPKYLEEVLTDTDLDITQPHVRQQLATALIKQAAERYYELPELTPLNIMVQESTSSPTAVSHESSL
eukprot:Sspe_Gene.24683::Locus_9817_Transcript_2_2_Confidence_0.667_Length_5707::g.24683::m.24683